MVNFFPSYFCFLCSNFAFLTLLS